MRRRRLLVLGGGAAGFFCAVNAARLNNQLEVLILEKSGKTLSKVRVSGGGRCNVTHQCEDIEEMVRYYPRGTHFLKKAFHHFFVTDMVSWLAERGVQLHTEADGRMFPRSNQSQTIIDCFLREAERFGVQVRLHADVVRLQPAGSGWQVFLSNGSMLEGDYVCVTTGGLSRQGGCPWLEALGHHLERPLPSLFTFNLPGHPITALPGISVPMAQLKIAGTRLQEKGPLLITHWGLSGPAVLRLSAWGARILAEMDYRFRVLINWAPEYSEQSLQARLREIKTERAAHPVSGKAPLPLPARLWQFLLTESGIVETDRWGNLPGKTLNKLVSSICSYTVEVTGKTSFKEEFVTAGGVRLSEIDPHHMQSRLQPGLYFAGEVMDVDGITGGFNFQHAWTSAYLAASAIAERAGQQEDIGSQ